MKAATVELAFPRQWRVEILAAQPAILPARRYVYPRAAEEVERGALEVLVHPREGQLFLATCALGFRDAAVPTGVWAMPNARELCAVAGGYAYVIDTAEPERFTFVAYRPVLEVRAVAGLLLFVGHRAITAWGTNGQAWETEKLSDEGVTITGVEGGRLRGTGWKLMTDAETAFAIELETGHRVE
jgi:hypothetical protein